MKRTDLLKKITEMAGRDAEFARSGGSHDVYRVNGQIVTVPRHREINEITARAIVKQVADALAKKEGGAK